MRYLRSLALYAFNLAATRQRRILSIANSFRDLPASCRPYMVPPTSLGTACPPSGRNSSYRPPKISEASSTPAPAHTGVDSRWEKWITRATVERTVLVNFCRRQAPVFAALYLLTVVVYSYLFTTIVFTDHTFSNAWLSPYPSFRTTVVARWFADFLNYLVGGAGVQSFQMAIGAGLQAINGILFAVLLGLKKRLHVFLSAAFICLHPAFLDYYSFAKDHISFTFGDTLAILGALALGRMKNAALAVSSATACFSLSIATYQPKIALVALLLLINAVSGAVNLIAKADVTRTFLLRRFLAVYFLPAFLSFSGAVILYAFSARAMLITPDSTLTKINGPGEMLYHVVNSFPKTVLDFTVRVDYLPRILSFLPSFAVLLGSTILVVKAARIRIFLGLIVLLFLILIAIALQLSLIINDNTYEHAARILTPYAYCLLFFIASLWLNKYLQPVATIIAAIFVYYFAIIGMQEAGELAMRHIFNVTKINRVVARIEVLMADVDKDEVPIVVIGYLTPNTSYWKDTPQPAPMRKFTNEFFSPQARSEVLNVYRQDEIFNYFLGRTGLTVVRPTQNQVDDAIASQWGKRHWPASDSVYVNNGVIVVLLQSYGPGVPVTVPREKFGGNLNWGL
jgi:hypothetical protein